ncbi:hypothetical protein [Pectinatus frisingensis]|uniref:hypothetical protein n=1 Tax=Pectinatus frisingensis TaxID=865 RepID=UPI0018C6E235|nr:hypothetical protein [Pectinatus frisingensis]
MVKCLKNLIPGFILISVLLLFPVTARAESVGGIGLGMSYQEVVDLYGKPQWCLNENQSHQYLGEYVDNMYVWKNGMTVHFDDSGLSSRVGIVKMNTPTDRKLDWSGLGLGDGDPNWWQTYGRVWRMYGDLVMHSNAAKEYIWVKYSQGYHISYIEINRFAE